MRILSPGPFLIIQDFMAYIALLSSTFWKMSEHSIGAEKDHLAMGMEMVLRFSSLG